MDVVLSYAGGTANNLKLFALFPNKRAMQKFPLIVINYLNLFTF